MGLADDLQQLTALHQRGVLSDGEFTDAKRVLLDGQPLSSATDGSKNGGSDNRPRPQTLWIVAGVSALVLLAAAGTALTLSGDDALTDQQCLEAVSGTGAEGAEFDAIIKDNGCEDWYRRQLSAEEPQPPIASAPPAKPTPQAVPFDVALARARAVIPELGQAPDRVVNQISGSMCLGVSSGRTAVEVIEVATDAGLSTRAAIGILQVAVTAVCPAQRDAVNNELLDADIQF